MGSGNSGLYSGTHGSGQNATVKLKNGSDYNKAGSASVRNVSSVNQLSDPHSVSMQGEKNSSTQIYRKGKMVSERYYNSKGNAYLDIDYTDHGNPKMHPDVPHEHRIHRKNGAIIRDDPPKGGIRKKRGKQNE